MLLLLTVILCAPASLVMAQAEAEIDTMFGAAGDTASTFSPAEGGLAGAGAAAEQNSREGQQNQNFNQRDALDPSFFVAFKNIPKAGTRTNVTTNVYYGEFSNIITMAEGANMTNRVNYSWSDFRQQVKTNEKRGANSSYSTGRTLPFLATLKGSWDWNEDNTTNAGGHENVSRRNYKTAGLLLSKPQLNVGAMRLTMKSSAGTNDQKSITQERRNDVAENYLDGGMQMGTDLFKGVTVAGRLFGRKTDGDRTLGENKAPSSSNTDTLGVGVYYDRNFTSGRVSLTRGNFNKKYLDYKRNTNGLIDTVGLAEEDKVVDEMEIKDAVTLMLVNDVRFLGMYLATTLSQTSDESDFAVSRVGLKEKLQQDAKFALSFSVGRDSLSIEYSYLWKWDDQKTKGAELYRGKQYKKERDIVLIWERTLFKKTKMRVNWVTGLAQDTAENGYVTTDKDRLRYDFSTRLQRNWVGNFQTNMVFFYRQNHDIALHSTRSSNNNVKDSYEISPSYSWPIADWLTFSQNYRLYIQYTDYSYSHLDGARKLDNYNKRGNLSTVVKMKPTKRLELTVKYDHNKRFSAEKTNEGTTGNSEYFVNQRQTIGKIDLSFKFKVANGVLLEGATYNTKDEKSSIGSTETVSERLEGKIWIGTKVSRKWGKKNPLELSAMVKKYNAYGPSISESSSDYWESDIWLKWEF